MEAQPGEPCRLKQNALAFCESEWSTDGPPEGPREFGPRTTGRAEGVWPANNRPSRAQLRAFLSTFSKLRMLSLLRGLDTEGLHALRPEASADLKGIQGYRLRLTHEERSEPEARRGHRHDLSVPFYLFFS